MTEQSKGLNRRYACNCVRLAHNSVDIQEKLKDMGFAELWWTSGPDTRQILIASSYPHRIRHTDVTYAGSFWNAGIAPIKLCDNVIDVGDDEEAFLNYAARIISEKEIYFDENRNEIKLN